MAAVVSSTDVPNSIQEALDDPTWKAAVKGIRFSGRQQNLGTCSKTSEPEDHQRQVAFFCQTRCRWRDPQVQGAVCGEGVHSNLRSGLQRDILSNRATYISAIVRITFFIIL